MPEMSKFVYEFYYKVIERLVKEQDKADKKIVASLTAANRFQVRNH